MDIIIVRHAESIANTQGIYQGVTYDTDLSETGRKQLQVLSKALGQYQIDAIYTSPLKRTMQTAEAISSGLFLAKPSLVPEIIEINHGTWEGKTKSEVMTEYPELLEAWKTQPEIVHMPEGENLQQVHNRVFKFLNWLHEQNLERVVVVTHDAVIRVILTKLLRRELNDLWMYKLDSAGYSIIEWNGKQPQVVKINENSHLNGLSSNLAVHAL